MYVLSVQYSCVVVSFFLFGGKANLVLLTLFYSTLLALTALTDRWRVKYARFAWAGGTFFPVVLLCQFFGCSGKQFVLVQFELKLIQICCIQGQYILFCVKLVMRYELQYINMHVNDFNILIVLVQLELKLIQIHVHIYCTIQLCGYVSYFVWWES